jgi:FemAB-related protein (PEP-CTERM system-associated)
MREGVVDQGAVEAVGGLSIGPFRGSKEEWNSWVAGRPESTFCHLFGWRDVMEEVFGHDTFYRVARDEQDTTRGLLPLVHVRSRLFGRYLISMPFLSYGGPLGSPEVRQLLAEDALEQAKTLGVDLLELRDRVEVPGPLETTNRKLTVVLNLPVDSKELWENGLKAKVRSQIRRPMKEGMEAAVGSHLLVDFYSVFSRTMRDLGTPVLPKRFFEALVQAFPNELAFCVVTLQDRPVAGGCGFFWGKEFEITWAGALREFSRMAPNMLLYWSFMEWASSKGAERFNFGRCTAGSGTHRFKKQWGGVDCPLPWAQWSPRGIASTPTPDGAKYRVATSIWRRLPLPVTNALGPLLARELP